MMSWWCHVQRSIQRDHHALARSLKGPPLSLPLDTMDSITWQCRPTTPVSLSLFHTHTDSFPFSVWLDSTFRMCVQLDCQTRTGPPHRRCQHTLPSRSVTVACRRPPPGYRTNLLLWEKTWNHWIVQWKLKCATFSVPQDCDVSGSAHGRAALLPQQGRTPSCGSRRGRQSVQPAHCAESSARGTVCVCVCARV